MIILDKLLSQKNVLRNSPSWNKSRLVSANYRIKKG